MTSDDLKYLPPGSVVSIHSRYSGLKIATITRRPSGRWVQDSKIRVASPDHIRRWLESGEAVLHCVRVGAQRATRRVDKTLSRKMRELARKGRNRPRHRIGPRFVNPKTLSEVTIPFFEKSREADREVSVMRENRKGKREQKRIKIKSLNRKDQREYEIWSRQYQKWRERWQRRLKRRGEES